VIEIEPFFRTIFSYPFFHHYHVKHNEKITIMILEVLIIIQINKAPIASSKTHIQMWVVESHKVKRDFMFLGCLFLSNTFLFNNNVSVFLSFCMFLFVLFCCVVYICWPVITPFLSDVCTYNNIEKHTPDEPHNA
jgi:Ca2+/Na+ antiporter